MITIVTIFSITVSANSEGMITSLNNFNVLNKHISFAQKNDMKTVQENISNIQNITQSKAATMSGTCGAVGNEANVIWVLEQNNQDSHNPSVHPPNS